MIKTRQRGTNIELRRIQQLIFIAISMAKHKWINDDESDRGREKEKKTHTGTHSMVISFCSSTEIKFYT